MNHNNNRRDFLKAVAVLGASGLNGVADAASGANSCAHVKDHTSTGATSGADAYLFCTAPEVRPVGHSERLAGLGDRLETKYREWRPNFRLRPAAVELSAQ